MSKITWGTIADRYKLAELIGRGGFGQVWKARDAIGRRDVALKLLSAGGEESLPRIRREQLLLRQLRVPGVVRFLGEGIHGSTPFLVMELVRGKPFPGAGRAGRAGPVREVAIKLAETLDRVHAQGVIHLDLKPENVLVGAGGQVTLLDFGIAVHARADDPEEEGRPGQMRAVDALTEAGDELGTPAYLAPEQLRGEAVTPRTDLYTFGLLLHEALLGTLPHMTPEGALDEAARMSAPGVTLPRRFREHARTRELAGLIDLLLRGNPDARPESARQVVEMLRGHALLAERDALPWLGSREPIERVLAAAVAGRSVDVVGPRGSGRRRCLQEVASRLQQQGTTVVWTRPSRAYPFSSLEPVIGALDPDHETLAELRGRAKSLLTARLAEGVVVIAASEPDRWSGSVLEEARAAGAMLRATSGHRSRDRAADVTREISLRPLSASDLLPLFRGPERLFHVATDAADLLRARTGGLPGQVVFELQSWVDTGLARLENNMYSVAREALDEAALGVRGSAPAPDRIAADLPAHLQDLLEHAAVLGSKASSELLARLTGNARWQVDAWLEELADVGAVQLGAGGRVEHLGHARAHSAWSRKKRSQVHLAVSGLLPAGDGERLAHLVSGRAPSLDVGEEALCLARRLAEEGHLGQAVIAIETGLLALRSIAGSSPAAEGLEERLLTLRVLVSFAEFGSGAYASARYDVSRAVRRAPGIGALEKLMDAAVALHEQSGDALAMVEAIAPFRDEDLERCRKYARVLAARYHPIETERAVLCEVTAPSAPRDALTLTRENGWRGRLAYREGRYLEAARLHAEAARGEPWATIRIGARLNSASALLEAARYGEAASAAEEALRELGSVRQPYLTARAEWLFRMALFRKGAAAAPDEELVLAAEGLDVPEQQATMIFTEAAIAYHVGQGEPATPGDRSPATSGDLALAARWAERARALFGARNPPGALIAECLVGAARGEPPSPKDEARIAARAADCRAPEIGLQSLALVAQAITRAAGRERPAEPRRPAATTLESARALLSRIGPEREHARWDVLSYEECLSALGLP
jgi:serine/threonine protein kinase/tetratricopeptide (TPR) repeat protein